MNDDPVDPGEGSGGDLLVRSDEAMERQPGVDRVTELPPRLRKRRRSEGDVRVSKSDIRRSLQEEEFINDLMA